MTPSGAGGFVRSRLRSGSSGWRRTLRAAVVAAALLATGCGGGEKDDPATVETKADYIAAGDRICRDRDRRGIKLVENVAGKTTADLSSELATLYADVNAKLLALKLPPGAGRAGAQGFASAVASLRTPVARMKATADEVAADIAAGGAKKATAQELTTNVNTVQAISDLVDQRARDYGFKSCGQQQLTVPIA